MQPDYSKEIESESAVPDVDSPFVKLILEKDSK